MATTRDPGREHGTRPGGAPCVGERMRQVMHGLLAVTVLLLTGIDALVTALVGVRPVAPVVRRWAVLVAEEYRAGRAGVVEAEVIDTDREVRR